MNTVKLPELLLVEDTSSDEIMSLRGIKRSGVACNVTVKRDGEEALRHLLCDETPLPSLVLLDYKLPKFNGLEVLTKLRKDSRTIALPIVMFCDASMGSAVKDCYEAGANGCVTKPYDLAQYIDRLALVTRYWLLGPEVFSEEYHAIASDWMGKDLRVANNQLWEIAATSLAIASVAELSSWPPDVQACVEFPAPVESETERTR